MNELKLVSQHPDSLKPVVEGVLAEALRSVEAGIQRTYQQLHVFETRYHLTTEEFIQRYEDDQFQETPDFDEWIGEYKMLRGLREDADRLRGIQIAD
jgi:hypothetical protein